MGGDAVTKWWSARMTLASAVVAVLVGMPTLFAAYPSVAPATRSYVADQLSDFRRETVVPLQKSVDEQKRLAIDSIIIGLETRKSIYETQIDAWDVLKRQAEQEGNIKRSIELNRMILNRQDEIRSIQDAVRQFNSSKP